MKSNGGGRGPTDEMLSQKKKEQRLMDSSESSIGENNRSTSVGSGFSGTRFPGDEFAGSESDGYASAGSAEEHSIGGNLAREDSRAGEGSASGASRGAGSSAVPGFQGKGVGGLRPPARFDRGGSFSRDEMNLAEFPLAALSTRVDPSVKTLEFSDTQRLKNGEIAKREWIITGADKFGLPTSTDDDVILGLIRLTMNHDFRSRKVFFTRYELMQILRWAPEGRNYTRLTRSLDRLSGVRIKATNAFFDNASKAFQTCNFGVIDAYEIVDGRNGKTGTDSQQSYFIWSEVLFDSFKSGFIKKLDLDLYFTLKSAVSRRLYRYLDKHFYHRPSLERPLMVLAFEKLGLSRSYRYVSSIKQQLEPAFDELIGAGFLRSYEYSGRGDQTMIRLSGAADTGASSGYSSSGIAGGPKSAEPRADARQASARFFSASQISTGQTRATGGAISRRSPENNAASEKLSFDFAQQNQREGRGGQVTAGGKSVSSASNNGSNPSGFGAVNLAAPGLSSAGDLGNFQRHLLKCLCERGLTEQQVARLLQGRGLEQLKRIHQIVNYYDYLILTGDSRVSKSPIGFLYSAVNGADRFTVPNNYISNFSTAAPQSSQGGDLRTYARSRENLGRLRPELKIMRADTLAESRSEMVRAGGPRNDDSAGHRHNGMTKLDRLIPRPTKP